MGYESTVIETEIERFTFDPPLPANSPEGRRVVATVEAPALAWLFDIRVVTDTEKRLGQPPVEYITGILILGGQQTGKAYTLEDELVALQAVLTETAGRALEGTVDLAGEEAGDLARYRLSRDGRIEKATAEIRYDAWVTL